jgi:flagellar basal-body rod modification protein FlgD
MATIPNPVTSNAGASAPPSSSASSNTSTAAETQVTEQQFLQLLVAQLQNQDPLDPMDGTQFVSQLAQFSELQQMIGVNQGVQQLVTDQQNTTSSSTNSNSTTPTP